MINFQNCWKCDVVQPFIEISFAWETTWSIATAMRPSALISTLLLEKLRTNSGVLCAPRLLRMRIVSSLSHGTIQRAVRCGLSAVDVTCNVCRVGLNAFSLRWICW